MKMGMCDRCNGEPAVCCNEDGNFLCEDCLFEESTEIDCDVCGDYHQEDAIPRQCETGDGV